MEDDGAQDPIAHHVAHLRYLNRRPSSIDQRARTLRRLDRFARGHELLELDPEILQRFVHRPGLGPEARAAAVSHLRGFFQWATEEGLIAADPSVRLKRPKRERRLPRPMLDQTITFALTEAPDPIRQWLYLGAYAGLRACEIAQLRGRDFLLSQTPPILLIRVSKGGDPSVVPIAEPLRGVAAQLAQIDGWCFPKRYTARGGDGHVTAGQVQWRTNRWLHANEIPETLHQARHWFGTNTHRATGGDLRKTQEAMRHKSPVSTAIYTMVQPDEVAAALDRLPRLVG